MVFLKKRNRKSCRDINKKQASQIKIYNARNAAKNIPKINYNTSVDKYLILTEKVPKIALKLISKKFNY